MIPLSDIHTHILPGIDDGSDSLETSLQMLRMEAEQGIAHVFATPHFYPQHNDLGRFLEARRSAELRLREAMAAEPGLPELHIGAEVYYFPGMSDAEILSELTMGKNGCILIEMPMGEWTAAMYRELAGIYEKQALLPVIAHVDRYLSPFRTYGIPEQLEALPVLVQANSGAFLSRSSVHTALKMLRRGQIHLLGSDAHNLGSRRPALGEAAAVIRRKLGDGALAEIAANESRLLETM